MIREYLNLVIRYNLFKEITLKEVNSVEELCINNKKNN